MHIYNFRSNSVRAETPNRKAKWKKEDDNNNNVITLFYVFQHRPTIHTRHHYTYLQWSQHGVLPFHLEKRQQHSPHAHLSQK